MGWCSALIAVSWRQVGGSAHLPLRPFEKDRRHDRRLDRDHREPSARSHYNDLFSSVAPPEPGAGPRPEQARLLRLDPALGWPSLSPSITGPTSARGNAPQPSDPSRRQIMPTNNFQGAKTASFDRARSNT